MAEPHEDHSGTPPKKFGAREGAKLSVAGAPEILGTGLADNGSASITEASQGLPFVSRSKDRPR
jgi:hypothetical protein